MYVLDNLEKKTRATSARCENGGQERGLRDSDIYSTRSLNNLERVLNPIHNCTFAHYKIYVRGNNTTDPSGCTVSSGDGFLFLFNFYDDFGRGNLFMIGKIFLSGTVIDAASAYDRINEIMCVCIYI